MRLSADASSASTRSASSSRRRISSLSSFISASDSGEGLPLTDVELVSAPPLLFDLRDGLTAPAIELDEALDPRAREALGVFGEQARGVLAQEVAW